MKTIKDVYDKLPDLDYTSKYREEKSNMLIYEVAGRKFQETAKIDYVLECLYKIEENYGERAKQASTNDNLDWKAISHAFRAGYQLKEIYETGDLKFPLKDAQFLKDVKYGKYHYQNDGIAQKLEDLVDEINELADKSDLPDKVDMKFWNEWLVSLYE